MATWTDVGSKLPGDVITAEIWNALFNNFEALAQGAAGAPAIAKAASGRLIFAYDDFYGPSADIVDQTGGVYDYTSPTAKDLFIECIGGGGGGANGESDSRSGGGGGGGEYAAIRYSVAASEVVRFTVGAGGAAQLNNGTAGNNGSLSKASNVAGSSNYVIANGGSGAADPVTGTGGAGGTGGTGDVVATGKDGKPGQNGGGTASVGGDGGIPGVGGILWPYINARNVIQAGEGGGGTGYLSSIQDNGNGAGGGFPTAPGELAAEPTATNSGGNAGIIVVTIYG